MIAPHQPMPRTDVVGTSSAKHPGHLVEVASAFLKLGVTSFGGPIAHVGYFRREFVERRRWLDEEHSAQLFALCQFLPGPASSQLGFSLGLLRAGWLGAIAAFISFTLPSALLLFLFAAFSDRLVRSWGQGIVHRLKLVAVAVVARCRRYGARARARSSTRAHGSLRRGPGRDQRECLDAAGHCGGRRGPWAAVVSRGDGTPR